MTKREQWIIDYLKSKNDRFVSPTEIGMSYGVHLHGKEHTFQYHSAWASPICKKLVEQGVLESSNRGWYKITKL